MKKLPIIVCTASLAAALSASATTTIYSDTDFSTMAYYNGSYVAGSPGYAALSYNSSPNGDVDAVVGVRGPLGALNGLSMSFQYSNFGGGDAATPGNAPFAAFGVSLNGTWGLGAQEFDIISEQGNVLNGNTLVHVWDFSLNGGNGGDVAGLSGVTLNYVLGINDGYNSDTFGDLEVMRAYAYVGDEGASSGSVDINSITISSVPEPTTMIAGGLLLLPLGVSAFRILRRRQTA